MLAGSGALAIPGFGPFIATGPIIATLAGAGVGGTIRGIGGALVGVGIPEYEAKHYECYLNDGGILLSAYVASPDEVSKAKKCLERTDAKDISSTREALQAKTGAIRRVF